MRTSGKTEVNSGGISLCGATFLVFLVLKLTGHIAWSWWWVTAPLWVPPCILGVILLGVLLFVGICALVVAAVEKLR